MAKEPMIKVAIGLAAPVQVNQSGGTYFGTTGTKAKSLSVDSALTNDFLTVRDRASFERFIKRYGVMMFQPYLKSCKVKKGESPFEHLLSMSAVPGGALDQNTVDAYWTVLEKVIVCWQATVFEAMKKRREGSEIAKLLDKAAARPVLLTDSTGNPVMVLHCEGIMEACLLQVALCQKPIKPCHRDGCDRLYFQRSPRGLYCSEDCKRKAFYGLPLQQYKNRLRVRVHGYKDLSASAKTEALDAISTARSETALRKIEKDHGLEKRTGPKAAKKGEARHGGTR